MDGDLGVDGQVPGRQRAGAEAEPAVEPDAPDGTRGAAGRRVASWRSSSGAPSRADVPPTTTGAPPARARRRTSAAARRRAPARVRTNRRPGSRPQRYRPGAAARPPPVACGDRPAERERSPMKVVIVINLFVLLPFVTIVGWLTSRILGVRLGFWRATGAATLGFLIGVLSAAVLTNSDDDLVMVPLGIFFGVLATMPLSIILELITRRTKPRRRRKRKVLLHPIRAVKAVFAPYGRLREVLHHARKQNIVHVRYASASALESPDFACKLRLVLEDAGGMFVKFGQIASTRTDMLPEPLTVGARPPARRGATGPGGRGPRRGRVGVRRVRRGGVRVVRLRAARGRVDRPDPSRGAARRHPCRGEDPAPRHRRHRPARRLRPALHGADPRTARRSARVGSVSSSSPRSSSPASRRSSTTSARRRPGRSCARTGPTTRASRSPRSTPPCRPAGSS